MSAALFGLVFGAIFAGPVADHVGRKKLLVGSVAFFGICSLAAAFAATLDLRAVLRFLTGLGLGAAMPNAVTLISEFMPERHRSVLVNAMFCGFPLGAAGGGFLAGWAIPHFGWHSVLVIGGGLPVLLAVALIVLLPESVRFMVLHNYPVAQIRKVMARVVKTPLSSIETFTVRENAPIQRSGVGTVLSSRYRVGSLTLWIAYFMGLLIFFLLTSWMLLLMKGAGLNLQRASFLTDRFPSAEG